MATEMSHSCMAVNSGRWALCPAAPAGIIWVRRAGRDGVQIKPFCRVLTGHIDVALLTAVLAVVADAQGALLLIYPIYAAYLIRLASLLRAQQIAAIACQGQAEIATPPVSSQMQVFGAAAAQDDQAAQGGKAGIQQGVGIMTDRARHVLEPLTKPACCCCTACWLYAWPGLLC